MFQTVELLVFQYLQPSDGCEGRSRGAGPGTASSCLQAGATVPDPHCPSLHRGVATEGAGVLGTLAHFNSLHLAAEGGAITGSVFTNSSDLLGAFMLPPALVSASEDVPSSPF